MPDLDVYSLLKLKECKGRIHGKEKNCNLNATFVQKDVLIISKGSFISFK